MTESFEAMLNDIEIRVLGVLLEKSLTQASSYPLTLNSITLGANQLQNRDPVVQYSEADVSAAIRTMMHKKLVTQAAATPGARAVRYEHKVVDAFHWDRREQAVMAELMLRGRQTAGELRTRASRMSPIPDLEAVTAILNTLKSTSPPFVEELPREPGRSANRFRHLLGDTSAHEPGRSETGTNRAKEIDASQPTGGQLPLTLAESSAHQPQSNTGKSIQSGKSDDTVLHSLAERLSTLESEVAALRAAVEEMRRSLPESVHPRDQSGGPEMEDGN